MESRKKAKPNISPNKAKPKIRGVEPTDNKVESQEDKIVTKSTNKYIRLKVGSTHEEREVIQQKVKDGLIKWAFYGIDNSSAYHYYLVIKK